MSLSAVHMPVDVYYACVLHALSVEEEEVMGLLIGKFIDDEAYVMSVIVLQRSDKRKDRVEISPDQLHSAIMKTSELSEAMGESIHVLGWYHSHPHITVQPSHVDLRTQASYQLMDSRFIGIIFSVFNEDKIKGQEIQVTCFQAVNQTRGGDPFRKVEVPLYIESVRKLSSICSESIFQLPQILSQEDLAHYEQSREMQTNYLSKLQNDSAFIMSQCHILSAIVNPLLLNTEYRLMINSAKNKQLQSERERLMKLLKEKGSGSAEKEQK